MRKEIILKQPNSITEARYEMSSMEKNIFYLVVSSVHHRDSKVCRISRGSLSHLVRNKINHPYFKMLAEQLLCRTLFIPVGKDKFVKLNLFSSAEYIEGKGCLCLEFSKEIRQLFLNLNECFTTLRLNEALSLSSKYAKRIYEMLSQYKDTGILRLSVDQLKYRLGLKKTNENGKEEDKYKKFTWFRKRILDVAQKELRNTNLNFEYKAIRVGKKYTHLHFKIERKKAEEPPQEQKVFKELVEKLHLSPWQAKKIMSVIDPKEIRKTFYEIQLKIVNKQLQNIGAYSAKAFDQRYQLGFFGNKSYFDAWGNRKQLVP